MSIPAMGGHFLYRQIAGEDTMVVDPGVQPSPSTQSQLKKEIEQYQAYFDMDLHFCKSVEGAAQESNMWVARNADTTGLSDLDLQRFKSIAWNECVVKRFLSTQNSDVSTVGQSMLHIVRTLNLQWKGMEVMGLHPKIESAEKQVVMSCMEKRLLGYDLDVGRIARCLRRSPHFRDHFSNAVGCHIVAKTGHTPGLSKTQYSADLDYVYKNQGLYFLESALQRNRGLVSECIKDGSALGVDYIPRLCGLKLVSKGDVMLQNPPEKQDVFISESRDAPREVVRDASYVVDTSALALATQATLDVADTLRTVREELSELRRTVNSEEVKADFIKMRADMHEVAIVQRTYMLELAQYSAQLLADRQPTGALWAAHGTRPAAAAPPPAAAAALAAAPAPPAAAAAAPPPAAPPAAAPPPAAAAAPPAVAVVPAAPSMPARASVVEVVQHPTHPDGVTPTTARRTKIPRTTQMLVPPAGDDPDGAARGMIHEFDTA